MMCAAARPVIGVLSEQNYGAEGMPKWQTGKDYIAGIERAGGVCIQLPVTEQTTPETLAQWMQLCHGLILPGGYDVAPHYYGQQPLPQTTMTLRALDEAEFALCHLARQEHIPLLGICRGVQCINVAFGGTLWQDIRAQLPQAICHAQNGAIRAEMTHEVTAQEGSLLAQLMGSTAFYTNTFHHQAVRDVALGFTATAHTADGVVEALESADKTMLGVQWHPENLAQQHANHAALFGWLVEMAGKRLANVKG